MERIKDGDIEIDSVNKYLELLVELRKKCAEKGGFSLFNKLFFRGQANAGWDITPSVFRNDLLNIETDLIKAALMRNPADFIKLTSDFDRLTKLQHYGLPTRLLDVTTNPLVALYFACQEREKENGAVYFKFAYSKGTGDIDTTILSFLTIRGIPQKYTLEKCLMDLETANIYGQNDIKAIRDNGYQSLINTLQHSFFVLPNYSNDRLARQNGAFLLAAQHNIIKTGEPKDYIIEKAQCSLNNEFEDERFVVLSDCKESILEELDFYGINESSMFPELEHQMKNILSSQMKNIVETVSEFAPYDNDIIKDVKYDDATTISESKEILFAVIKEKISSEEIIDQCLQSIESYISIDWYKKDSTVSKIRFELKKVLVKQGKENIKDADTLVEDIINETQKRLKAK